MIREAISTRLANPFPKTSVDWDAVVAAQFNEDAADGDERRARMEKARALSVLAESRVAVLVGPAGTGKTLVVGMLLGSLPEGGDAVLLAPTGKARVRLQAAAKREAKTLAQFLLKLGRYEGASQRYFPTGGQPAPGVRMVVVDEASMLTEDQIAALFDALEPGCRVLFVGDPQQLPPIGAGRPFVDLVQWLMSQPSRPGVAELRVRRRQTDSDGRRDLELEDVQFAELFSGRPLPAGEDEILARIRNDESMDRLQFTRFKSDSELRDLVKRTISEELELTSDKEQSFALRLEPSSQIREIPIFLAAQPPKLPNDGRY